MRETTYKLLLDIMNPKIQSNISHIKETIFLAEDTIFNTEQSKVISPWLLDFVNKVIKNLEND